MKRYLLVLAILLYAHPAFGQSPKLDQATVDIANQLMMDLYYSILENKGRHSELNDFGQSALKKNKYGIYILEYSHFYVDARNQKKPYGFGVTVTGTEDDSFANPDEKKFRFTFPLLGLQIAGYQVQSLRRHFDVLRKVQAHGELLWKHQQNYIPLKLSIESTKDIFKVGEKIEYVVTLTNTTGKNMMVKDLSSESLVFRHNKQPVPSKEDKKSLHNIVLRPGLGIKKTFSSRGYQFPREFDIYCIYDAMNFKGVHPSGVLKVKVVK